MTSGRSTAIPVQLPPSTLRRKIAAAVKRVRLRLPLPARVVLVRRLSSTLLIQAIGNLEGRDELFWLRREVWAQAHRVLGIDPSRDRFTDTGWEFAFENEVASTLFMPFLAAVYRDRRDRHLAAWLDEIVTRRWVECVRSYRNTRAWEEKVGSRASDIDRRMRGHVVRTGDSSNLSALSSALADARLSGREWVGLIVTRPGSLKESYYAPVLERLQSGGVFIVWLAIDSEAHGKDVRVLRHPWGLEVSLPPPCPEELLCSYPEAQADYRRLLEKLEFGLRCLPGRRELVAPAVNRFAASVYKWLAASLVARRVFDSVSPRFIHVLPDKDVEARAFVAEARKRGVPSFFHYGSIDLGAPQYWPFSDRILVSNGARAERLTECLGVPDWRVEPVGDLEVDRVLREVRAAARPRAHNPHFRLTFLLKWPAETVFGRPEELLELLRALPAKGHPWILVLRPNPRDNHNYGWLEQVLPGRIRVVGPGYRNSEGLAETVASADLIVSAMGNAGYCAIAAGKPTVIYNPDPKINLGHDRLFARDDLPRHLRLVTDRDALVRLLRRVIGGEEPDMLAPEPLKPSLVRYLFHSLDGHTADRIADALLKSCEVTCRP